MKFSEVRAVNEDKVMIDIIHENWNSRAKSNSPCQIFREILKPKMDEFGKSHL